MARRKRKQAFRPDSRPMYWQAVGYQEQLFQMFCDDLINLAMARFKWTGLPETCDARYLEWVLLFDGAATIAFPAGQRGVFRSLKAVQQGIPNDYGIPTSWRAIGDTGRTQFMCNWSNGVFLYENATRYPLIVKLNIWARELADILQVKQVNRFHMRMPIVITGPQDRALDVQNFYAQIAHGEPITLGYDTFSDVQVTATMPERAKEFIGDKLDEQWRNTWDAIYRELGIDSLPYKGERMIEDEVNSTNEPTEIAALGPLGERRRACDKLNERFGDYLDEPVRVVWNRDNLTDNWDFSHRYDALMGGAEDAAV